MKPYTLLTAVFSAMVFGQSELATLTGILTDPSGGVISNAEITVTNEGTNIPTVSKSNETGRSFGSRDSARAQSTQCGF